MAESTQQNTMQAWVRRMGTRFTCRRRRRGRLCWHSDARWRRPGLVTSLWVTVFGAVLMVSGCVGWFRQVLPHEAHEDVPVVVQPVTITTTRKVVQRLEIGPEHRSQLPVETYPVLSGLKGGIAGGIAMIFPALAYGLIAQHSIWYPVNLLGGAGGSIGARHDGGDHAVPCELAGGGNCDSDGTCCLVGLLYGAMLPMLPNPPAILGGIVAPLLWTGLLHPAMGVINPALDARIQWGWFVVSQVTFGVVAGLVVARGGKDPNRARAAVFCAHGD